MRPTAYWIARAFDLALIVAGVFGLSYAVVHIVERIAG